MITNFEIPMDTAMPQESTITAVPLNMEWPKLKHRKAKTKKAARKALKKAEEERDHLLYMNGRLTLENEFMKRTIALSIAANRRQLDDGLAENALCLLPPKKSRR